MLYPIGIVSEKFQIYNIMPVNSTAEQDVKLNDTARYKKI